MARPTSISPSSLIEAARRLADDAPPLTAERRAQLATILSAPMGGERDVLRAS